MGNNALTTISVWKVCIESIDLERRRVKASWNSNPVQEFGERAWSKWRATQPMPIRSAMCAQRLATVPRSPPPAGAPKDAV